MLLALLVATMLFQLFLSNAPDLPEAGVGRVAGADVALAVAPTKSSAVILGQPLFSPTRSGAAGGGDANAAAPLGGATVVGTLARGRAVQLFLRSPDGKVRMVTPGGSYLGWTLLRVAEDSAQFGRAGEKISVSFGSQATAPTASGDETQEEE